MISIMAFAATEKNPVNIAFENTSHDTGHWPTPRTYEVDLLHQDRWYLQGTPSWKRRPHDTLGRLQSEGNLLW